MPVYGGKPFSTGSIDFTRNINMLINYMRNLIPIFAAFAFILLSYCTDKGTDPDENKALGLYGKVMDQNGSSLDNNI